MSITSKSGRKVQMPSTEEDARVEAGALFEPFVRDQEMEVSAVPAQNLYVADNAAVRPWPGVIHRATCRWLDT
jgi:hypothetical protein